MGKSGQDRHISHTFSKSGTWKATHQDCEANLLLTQEGTSFTGTLATLHAASSLCACRHCTVSHTHTHTHTPHIHSTYHTYPPHNICTIHSLHIHTIVYIHTQYTHATHTIHTCSTYKPHVPYVPYTMQHACNTHHTCTTPSHVYTFSHIHIYSIHTYTTPISHPPHAIHTHTPTSLSLLYLLSELL
jgi:hypothetical protein